MDLNRNKRKEANLNINTKVAENLKRLLEEKNISQGELSEGLEKVGNGFTLDRTTINKIINDPNTDSISLPFLAACTEYLHTTVDELISEHGNKRTDKHDVPILPVEIVPGKQGENCLTDRKKSEFFVDDPNSAFFRNYLNKYYCYYYSTVSKENKGDNPILSGELTLTPEESICRCILKINTRKNDRNGREIIKTYTGEASICLVTQTVHCRMREEKIGEYCDLMFRYSSINNAKQACRMAEVLSTSSLPDKRYPVVHRMLLSIEPIDTKHFDLIRPQLSFNCSEMIIEEDALNVVAEQSVAYENLIRKLKRNSLVRMYRFDEKAVKDAAKECKLEETDQIVNRLRSYSYSHRYNKVSTRVDSNIWDILHAAGYYKEEVVQ